MDSIRNPKGICFVWVGGRVWVDGVGGRAGGLAGLGGGGWQREGRGACRESEHNVLVSCTDHIVVNLLWLDHIGPYSGGAPSAPLFFSNDSLARSFQDTSQTTPMITECCPTLHMSLQRGS